MKKTNSLIWMAAAVCLMATACSKVTTGEPAQEEETVQEENVVVFHATAREDDTKAQVALDGGAFSWTAGTDKIAVATNAGYKISAGATSVSGDNASFSVTLGGATLNTNAFALFPHTLVWDDDANEGKGAAREDCDTDHDGYNDPLVVYLRSSYTIGEVTSPNAPCPIIAKIVDNGEGGVGVLEFRQLCAMLCIKVNSVPKSAKSLVFDFNGKKVSGKFEIAANPTPGTSSIVADDNDSFDTIIVTGLDNEGWTDGLIINLPIPTGVASTNEFTTVKVTAKNSSSETVLEMTRPIKVGANWVPARATRRKIVASLPAFSVSDDLRVSIARSNLKCYTTDEWDSWSWSFMENPWDIVETTNLANANYVGATAIGLFCWGTSGHSAFFSDSHYGQYWQPYNTTNSRTDYGPIEEIDGVIYNYKDLTGDYKNGDWGVEAGSIEGYSTWRTPTKNEYMYLFGLKNNTATGSKSDLDAALASSDSDPDHRYSRRVNNWGIGKVNGVIGMIIVPDHFVDPTGGSFSFGYMQPQSSSAPQPLSYKNTFSEEGWKPMEAAGAIFMPVAGVRSGTSFTNSRTARYWTSSMNETIGNASGNLECYQLGFNEYLYNLRVVRENRGTGRAVRLVRDLN